MSHSQGTKKSQAATKGPPPSQAASKGSPMTQRRNKKKAEPAVDTHKEEAEPTASKTPRTEVETKEEDREEDMDFEARKQRKHWPGELGWPSYLQAYLRIQSVGEPEKVGFLISFFMIFCLVHTGQAHVFFRPHVRPNFAKLGDKAMIDQTLLTNDTMPSALEVLSNPAILRTQTSDHQTQGQLSDEQLLQLLAQDSAAKYNLSSDSLSDEQLLQLLAQDSAAKHNFSSDSKRETKTINKSARQQMPPVVKQHLRKLLQAPSFSEQSRTEPLLDSYTRSKAGQGLSFSDLELNAPAQTPNRVTQKNDIFSVNSNEFGNRKVTQIRKGQTDPLQSSPSNSWAKSNNPMETDLFPFVRLENHDDHVIVHTHRRYHETIFNQEEYMYNLQGFHDLELQLKNHLGKLDTFFNQDTRYLYTGHLRMHECLSGCKDHQMIVTHNTDHVSDVIGSNAKYWVLPIRYPDVRALQLCPKSHRENYWEDRTPIGYVAMLNSSDTLSDCYMSLYRRLSSYTYTPNCMVEGLAVKDPFQITKTDSLEECHLRCISRHRCLAFSLVYYTNGTSECLLGESPLNVLHSYASNASQVSYSQTCEHCEAGGGPAVLAASNPLRLTGQCVGVPELALSAHCLCTSRGWDAESTTSLAAVHGMLRELNTNSLQTDENWRTEPNPRRSSRQKRAGYIGLTMRSVGTSLRSMRTSFSDLVRRLKTRRPGSTTNEVVPWNPAGAGYSRFGSGSGGFMSRIKPGMKRFMKKLYSGAELMTVPLIATVVAWELASRIKGALNPEKEPTLTDLLPMFVDEELTSKFPVSSVDEDGRNFTFTPFINKIAPTLPFTNIEKIHDFQSARALLRNVLKLAKIVATGSQLWDYLMKGGKISPQGNPRLEGNVAKPHMMAWAENSTIRQLSIRPTNETQPLEYFAVAVLPSGSAELTKELLFSTALDNRGIVYSHTSTHHDCVDKVTQEQDLSGCFQNSDTVPQVSCIEASPSHNLVRLISRHNWHVLMRCPASRTFQYLDLSPVTLLFMHKSCVLTWRTGADLWENPDISIAWPSLRLAKLYKIIYNKSYPKPIPVSWIMTLSNTGIIVMTMCSAAGIVLWIKCHGRCRCISASDAEFDSRITIERSRGVPESPRPRLTPKVPPRSKHTKYEMAPVHTRERRPSGRSLPPVPSAPAGPSSIEYASEERLPPSGTLRKHVKYIT